MACTAFLAASCIAWLDPATGTAAIESLGVRPEYSRRGLAGENWQAVLRCFPPGRYLPEANLAHVVSLEGENLW